MHCRMMTINSKAENYTWRVHGRGSPKGSPRRLVDPARPTSIFRNCRQDVPAGKSIGRASRIAFSHIHFLFPSKMSGCAWRWPTGGGPTPAPPDSCTMVGQYPSNCYRFPGRCKDPSFDEYGIFSTEVGSNHGGGKFLAFPGGYRGFAARAFVNVTLNEQLHARVSNMLAKLCSSEPKSC